MRGWGFACAVACFSFASAYSQDRLEVLKNQEKILLSGLERIENGKDPCSADACQTQKTLILEDLFEQSDRFPSAGDNLLPSRDEGINSAYKLIRLRLNHTDPSLEFPHTLKAWVSWWKKRYSQEEKIQS